MYNLFICMQIPANRYIKKDPQAQSKLIGEKQWCDG